MIFAKENRRLFFGETMPVHQAPEIQEVQKELTLGDHLENLGTEFKERGENLLKTMKEAWNDEPEACKKYKGYCDGVINKMLRATMRPGIRYIDQKVLAKLGVPTIEGMWDTAVNLSADILMGDISDLKAIGDKVIRGEQLGKEDVGTLVLLLPIMKFGKGVKEVGEEGVELVRKRFSLNNSEGRGKMISHIKQASLEWGDIPPIKRLKELNPEKRKAEIEKHVGIFEDALGDIAKSRNGAEALSENVIGELRMYGMNIYKAQKVFKMKEEAGKMKSLITYLDKIKKLKNK